MAICAVLKGDQLERAKGCDLVELRLDLMEEIPLRMLKGWMEKCSLPMIFTLKGKLTHRALEYARLKPAYIDLESTAPYHLFDELKGKVPVICSYHNFDETPENLEALFARLQTIPAILYKIATYAKTTSDCLRLLKLAEKFPDKILAISMGEKGEVSRFLSRPFTYGYLEGDAPLAPGQFSLKTQKKELFGLIGNPLNKSRSPEIHNRFMEQMGLQAHYLKMEMTEEDLDSIRSLPFKGVSVTMPLKEAIIPHLDMIDPIAKEMGAVNTLKIQGGKIAGYNTDGFGALDALERKGLVLGKRLLILGAGGAAKAIAYEAMRRGAEVFVWSRNREKGEKLGYPWTETVDDYDILVNCTPASMPISKEAVIPGTHVMDCAIFPKMTRLLQVAEEKGCTITFGEEMFVLQAMGQYSLWFDCPFCEKNRENFQGILSTMRIGPPPMRAPALPTG